jgi:Zn-dependent metalloprotease
MSIEKEILNLDEIENSVEYETLTVTGLDNVVPIDKLKLVSQSIKENGKLNIVTKALSEENLNKLKTNLRLSGYIVKDEDGLLVCTRKIWAKNKSENPWKMIKLEEKSDLILEKDLIDPNEKYEKFSKAEDCITKPKPCKNCNCGKAKQLDKENADKVPTMKSDCGKCYLGDAYRCAGCPYRGLPAFEPGDKIELKNTQVQETNIESEKTNVNVTGSKVKIDL